MPHNILCAHARVRYSGDVTTVKAAVASVPHRDRAARPLRVCMRSVRANRSCA